MEPYARCIGVGGNFVLKRLAGQKISKACLVVIGIRVVYV